MVLLKWLQENDRNGVWTEYALDYDQACADHGLPRFIDLWPVALEMMDGDATELASQLFPGRALPE